MSTSTSSSWRSNGGSRSGRQSEEERRHRGWETPSDKSDARTNKSSCESRTNVEKRVSLTPETARWMRKRFWSCLHAMVGSEVQVRTRKPAVFHGTFHSWGVEDFSIIVKQAILQTGPDGFEWEDGQTLHLAAEELVEIKAKEATVKERRRLSGFLTDSAISGKANPDLVGRRLEAAHSWVSSSLEGSGLEDELDDLKSRRIYSGASRGKGWNQFETNARLFGVKTTYDENLYTTKLDRKAMTREQEQKAVRLAKEIESSSSSNLHIQEERGRAVQVDDEEALYSSVARSTPSTKDEPPRRRVRGEGAYIPPALRGNQKKGGPTSSNGNRIEKDSAAEGPCEKQEQDLAKKDDPDVSGKKVGPRQEQVDGVPAVDQVDSMEECPVMKADAKDADEEGSVQPRGVDTDSTLAPATSKKSTLNANAKEFKLNAEAAEFTPSGALYGTAWGASGQDSNGDNIEEAKPRMTGTDDGAYDGRQYGYYVSSRNMYEHGQDAAYPQFSGAVQQYPPFVQGPDQMYYAGVPAPAEFRQGIPYSYNVHGAPTMMPMHMQPVQMRNSGSSTGTTSHGMYAPRYYPGVHSMINPNSGGNDNH